MKTKNFESGRSMVEMLGVLAVMGVLSVTGIAAYNNAMNSLKANTILHEVNKRAHTCVPQLLLMNKTECSLSEYSDKIEDKYLVSTKKHNNNNNAFEIRVADIPQEICQQIKNKGLIMAGKIEPETCANLNQMVFVFNTDLNGKECQEDTDCTVCGHCVEGVCTQACEIPEPDDDKNCGKNECVVYDEETNSCQYQCVQKEWLESTGKQWIDTGLQYVQGDTIELNGRFVNPAQDDGLVVMQPWNTPNNSRFMFAIATSLVYSFSMSYNTLPANQNNPQPQYLDDQFHTWHYEGLTLTIDDGLVSLTNTENYNQGSGTLRLFYRPNGACATAIKYYKQWRDGVLICDFIPVLSPEGEACLFDKVSEKLFCNAGTGGFKTN